MSGQPDKDARRCPPDPFTSLTKFIDECISYTLQSVIGLPSSKEDISSWKPWEELQRRDKQSWDWRVGDKFRDDKVYGESDHHCGSNQRRDSVILDESIERCPPSEGLSRLENFLSFSRYSPTVLENDLELRPLREIWRHAFTDLMNESQGGHVINLVENKDLVTRNLHASAWRNLFLATSAYNLHVSAMRRHTGLQYGSGLHESPLSFPNLARFVDIMSSDVLRYQRQYSQQIEQHHPELLNDLNNERQREFFEDHADQEEAEDDQGGDDSDEDRDENSSQAMKSATELDMLEMLAKVLGEEAGHDEVPAVKQNESRESPELGRPSVIGKMTKIERVVKADGTIETRRVLRTRFSDGTENEESSSDIVVGRTPHHPIESQTESESDGTAKPPTGCTAKESEFDGQSGWFWKRSSR